MSEQSDSEKLMLLAKLFDRVDSDLGIDNAEIQNDLRRYAALLAKHRELCRRVVASCHRSGQDGWAFDNHGLKLASDIAAAQLKETSNE